MPPSYTVVERGIRTNRVQTTSNNAKKRVSVLLLVRADGVKYSPLIVYKGVSDARVSEEVTQYNDDEGLHTVQENAWTDQRILEEWCETVWKPIVEEDSDKKMLMLDSLRLHKSNEELLKCDDEGISEDVIINYVPEHCTAFLQPLDIGVIKIFKQNFRRLWARNQELEVSRELLSDWIKEAWQEVPIVRILL